MRRVARPVLAGVVTALVGFGGAFPVTMVSQIAPGMAVLATYGYRARCSARPGWARWAPPRSAGTR